MPFYPLKPLLLGKVAVNGFLSVSECQHIIETTERTMKLAPGATEGQRTGLRQSDITWLDADGENGWLFDRIKECINEINRNYFGFDLAGFEGIQFTRYARGPDGAGDHYGAHKDTRVITGGTIRKLSFTIQLSDPGAYEGGEVVLYDSFTEFYSLSREAGSISFFPSYTIHEVTPVTRGTRYSLVGWACGPEFV